MAGRIRSIKPEILEDSKVAALTHLEYRLFVGSWLLADDHGNLRGDPDYIRGQVVWSSRESRESVAKALETLATVGLLTHYRVRGQSYYHVTNWDKHQRVDKPGKPRMPVPAEAESDTYSNEASNSRESREDSRESRESLATDLRPPTSDHEHELELGGSQGSPRKAKRSSKPSLPMPEGWTPDGLAAAQLADFEHFAAHHASKGNTFVSWPHAWATWRKRGEKFQSSGASGLFAKPNPRVGRSEPLPATAYAADADSGDNL